jgi:hypothetical protein
LVRAVSSYYKRRAKARGIENPRVGCVAFTQRFDSALRLNLHFHVLWMDGVYWCGPGADGGAEFHVAERLTDDDVERLARALRDRVMRFLQRSGKLSGEAEGCGDVEHPVLEMLSAAAVQGRRGLGPRAGAHAPRLGRGSAAGGEFRRGKLCADCEGFSVHAGVRIPGYCRERLEKLCRYAARPPVVHERLSLSADGSKVLYKLKRRYRDGSTHVVLEPLELIERLAALALARPTEQARQGPRARTCAEAACELDDVPRDPRAGGVVPGPSGACPRGG